MNLLNQIFPGDQARLAADFPEGAFTASDLAIKLGRSETETEEMLEDMADKAMIFVTDTKAAVRRYELMPFFPGLLEENFYFILNDFYCFEQGHKLKGKQAHDRYLCGQK